MKYAKLIIATVLLLGTFHAARATIESWTQTAASNTDVAGTSIAEGMAPSGVNNAMREILQEVARFIQQAVSNKWDTDTGSANAYIITPAIVPTSLVSGQQFRFEAANTNTGDSSLQIGSLSAVSMVKLSNTVLAAGDIQADVVYDVIYDGTFFQVMAHRVSTVNTIGALTPTASKVPYFNSATEAALLDFYDTDAMTENSASAVASQQSVKAYVDTQVAAADYQFVETNAITAAATLDTQTTFEAGYDYIIQLEAFALTTDGQVLEMLFSDDGSTFEADAGDYRWKAGGFTHSGTFSDADASDTEIQLSGDSVNGNDASRYSTMRIEIINPMGTGEPTTAIWSGAYIASDGNPNTVTGYAEFLQGTDAVQGVRFQWGGGSTFKAQGDITVYRRKRS